MRFKTLRVAPLVASCVAVLMAAPPASAQTATTPAGAMSGWTPGPGAALSDTYTGSIDAPTNGASVGGNGSVTVDGWFVDTTAQGWAGADDVQVFLGQMGSGGTMLAKGVVAENRPDVSSALNNPYWSASGFFANVPSTSIPAGTQTLDVYVHTPGKGWWYEPVTVNVGSTGASTPTTGASTPATGASTPATSSSPAAPAASSTTATGVATGAPQVTITNPTENQNISTKSGDQTITGNVSEPGATASDIDRIQVWMDGERDSGTLIGTVTPLSDGSWSVTFTPTHFASTHSNIYVYAHSRSTGQETESVRGFNITDQ